MIRRCLIPVLWCGTAFAQLPLPQAPAPREQTPMKFKSRKGALQSDQIAWRVDAAATGPDGKPVTGLTAADFEITTDGKPRPVTGCEFKSAGPQRIAFVVDDLSLSQENLALVRNALHRFVADHLRPGDEAAILRTSAGDGGSDRFQSDRTALDTAIDGLACNRPADDSTTAYGAGSLGALRSALLGMQFTSGRKPVVFLSERLRTPERAGDSNWIPRLLNSANDGSAVLYAVDVSSTADPSHMLEQGLAGIAPQTGGAFFDAAGNPAAVLDRIADAQQGYYLLQFDTDPLDRISPLVVKTARPGVRLAARNAVLGLADEGEGPGFVAPQNQLGAALGTTLLGTGVRLGVTPRLNADRAYMEAVFHIDANDVSFTLQPDRQYHAELQLLAALFQETDTSANHAERLVSPRLSADDYKKATTIGLDYPLRLAMPKKGSYQLRAAVLDETGGRVGAASRFLQVSDPQLPPLSMAPIVMEPGEGPDHRTYAPGHRIQYTYDLSNLHADPQRHAKVEVRNQLLREGKVVFDGKPQILDLALPAQTSQARISGTVSLGAQIQPGKFTLIITAIDTLAAGPDRRGVTQTIDFEIQP